jgi:hypothetical protein
MQGAQAENAHTVTPAFTLLSVRQLHNYGPHLPAIPPRYAIVPAASERRKLTNNRELTSVHEHFS